MNKICIPTDIVRNAWFKDPKCVYYYILLLCSHNKVIENGLRTVTIDKDELLAHTNLNVEAIIGSDGILSHLGNVCTDNNQVSVTITEPHYPYKYVSISKSQFEALREAFHGSRTIYNAVSIWVLTNIRAAYNNNKVFRGVHLEKGQIVTSVSELCNATGMTTSQARTALSKLQDYGFLEALNRNEVTRFHYSLLNCIGYGATYDEILQAQKLVEQAQEMEERRQAALVIKEQKEQLAKLESEVRQLEDEARNPEKVKAARTEKADPRYLAILSICQRAYEEKLVSIRSVKGTANFLYEEYQIMRKDSRLNCDINVEARFISDSWNEMRSYFNESKNKRHKVEASFIANYVERCINQAVETAKLKEKEKNTNLKDIYVNAFLLLYNNTYDLDNNLHILDLYTALKPFMEEDSSESYERMKEGVGNIISQYNNVTLAYSIYMYAYKVAFANDKELMKAMKNNIENNEVMILRVEEEIRNNKDYIKAKTA